MAINLAQIYNELKPGLNTLTGKYREAPLELDDIFVQRQSYMNQEFSVQMRYTGIAQLKNDGQSVAYDNSPGERFKYNMRPIGAGLGVIFTRNTLADNLYKDAFGPAVIGLQNSMRYFWNVQAAYLFNTAGTYDPNTGGSGQPLASTAHPVDGSTFANTTTTPQDLSEASLVAAIKTIPTTFVDQANLLIDVLPETLFFPWNLRDTALRLLNAELRPGTANNDPNIIHDLNGHIRPKVSRFLTSQYAWFLLTSVKGFVCFEREPYEEDMFCDFDTDNLKLKNYQRRGYFWNDPRAVYAQLPTQ
jgi:hypothetical protein